MPQPNQVIIPPQRKRWYRVRSWIWVIFLVLFVMWQSYAGVKSFLRHHNFWDLTPTLISLCFCISLLQFQWIALFPRVLTVALDGLQLETGAFPFRKRWLAPWKDAVLLRNDQVLMLAGVRGRPLRAVIVESYLSDTSRDSLIARLNALCQQQSIALATEDRRIRLKDLRFFDETAGGTDPRKNWKG